MNATLRILSAHPSSVILKPVQTGFVDVNKLNKVIKLFK
jgi:hypothetical protein